MSYDVQAALAGERSGQAVRAVLTTLRHGPQPQSVLRVAAADAGFTWKTVESHLGGLNKAGYVWSTGRASTRQWGLTPFGEDLARSLT